MKLCLVCSAGGHFLHLYFLKEFWQEFDHFWVTFLEKEEAATPYDARFYDTQLPLNRNVSVLRNEKTYNAYHPTNRNIKNLIKNMFLAFKVLRKEKPDIVISTGAGVGVAFIYVAKLLGMKTIYVELAARVERLSLSGLLVYPIVDHLFVQWSELSKKYKKAKFVGQII